MDVRAAEELTCARWALQQSKSGTLRAEGADLHGLQLVEVEVRAKVAAELLGQGGVERLLHLSRHRRRRHEQRSRRERRRPRVRRAGVEEVRQQRQRLHAGQRHELPHRGHGGFKPHQRVHAVVQRPSAALRLPLLLRQRLRMNRIPHAADARLCVGAGERQVHAHARGEERSGGVATCDGLRVVDDAHRVRVHRTQQPPLLLLALSSLRSLSDLPRSAGPLPALVRRVVIELRVVAEEGNVASAPFPELGVHFAAVAGVDGASLVRVEQLDGVHVLGGALPLALVDGGDDERMQLRGYAVLLPHVGVVRLLQLREEVLQQQRPEERLISAAGRKRSGRRRRSWPLG